MSVEEHGIDAPGVARTLRMGLVGRGIGLSRTPAMHEAEAAEQGLDCRYDLIDSDGQAGIQLSDILDTAEADGFAGLNITYPYKQDVISLLDEISDAARRVGAVNTVVFKDGRRFGHNTDFWGFAESFRRGLPDAPLETVLLIGAGGAGGAVAHALSDLGARCILISDTRIDAAEALAAAVCAAGGQAEVAPDLAGAAARANGIVNATPMGMAKLPGTPFDVACLRADHWVADIVYFPLETALLKASRAVGCRTLPGEGMAIFQAVRAFELFTRLPADPDRMRATFRSFGAE
ncbi:shikimate dehydrogenase [Sulfitobacter sp. EhC04]|uniref:shikimate dehydrogenase n=1 Tax=Sulfitobacter sp. EhC04 TaxID=1849168 RepID=UPI0007F3CCAE|nr:shikimate dehydrogenase [Sulfitobacter sp. EhC04]OAN75650.1 shikimate dehydrogenase [Sulfitobacter sp. EhC04]